MNQNTEIQPDAIENLKGRYLLVYIDNTLYGIPLALVLEILQVQKITRLPGIAYYVKGIVNLRGKIVPVIDIRLKFNLPEREYDAKTCIVVLEMQDTHIGLIVDSVLEVATVDPSTLAPPPSTGDSATRYLSSITKLGDKVVLNIDFDRFFQDDLEYLSKI